MRYHKAPASRIYESEQPLHQTRFPEKRRSVKFSTTPKLRTDRRRALLESQQTVTQMGWAVPMEDVERSDGAMIEDGKKAKYEEKLENSEEVEGQLTKARMRSSAGSSKRRRTVAGKTESQDTLTQMHWFVGDSDEDEDDVLFNDDSEGEEEFEENQENNASDIPPSGQGYSSSPNEVPLQAISLLHPLKEETRLTPNPSPSPSPVKSLTPPNPNIPSQIPMSQSTNLKQPESVFKIPTTPQKRHIRREIPSSQSPATTPLSMYSNTNSTGRAKRTPLSEIPRNELAVRDLSASPSPTKRKTPLAAAKGGVCKRTQRRRKKTRVQDSDDDNATDVSADEQENSPSSSSENDDDEENHDPESNIPKPPAFGKKQKQHAPSSSAVMGYGTQAPSLTASAFTSAYTPAPPSSASIGQSAGPSVSPSADTQFTHTLVRSSQASTVDVSQPASPEHTRPSGAPPQDLLSQPQQRSPAVPNSRQASAPTSSFRTACTSSMPEPPMSTATSVLQRGRWRECSPVASINNSLDIITVSQLVPKNLGMDF